MMVQQKHNRVSSPLALPRPSGFAGATLSVIVPMYQEERRIGPTLDDILATLSRWGELCEVVLVNDGSRDRTGLVVQEHAARAIGSGITVRLVEHAQNQGKGAAVATGLRESSGAWMLVMDADNSATVLEVLKLARQASGDVAMIAGSRATPDAMVEAKFTRMVSGLIFRTALRCMGLSFARDTQCGFKLYRRDFGRYLGEHAREPGFAFDVEHFALARHVCVGVREVGIRWQHAEGGSINVVRDGLRMLRQAWRIRSFLRQSPPPRLMRHDGHPGATSRVSGVAIESKPLVERAHAQGG
jgi:dolichyl-phosphate beta-glucosyltransferase